MMLKYSFASFLSEIVKTVTRSNGRHTSTLRRKTMSEIDLDALLIKADQLAAVLTSTAPEWKLLTGQEISHIDFGRGVISEVTYKPGKYPELSIDWSNGEKSSVSKGAFVDGEVTALFVVSPHTLPRSLRGLVTTQLKVDEYLGSLTPDQRLEIEAEEGHVRKP
jgi:hypothetical protein